VAVFFANEDFSISRVVELPVSVVDELKARADWVAGWKLRLTSRVLARPDVLDHTSELRDLVEKNLDFRVRDAASGEDNAVDAAEVQLARLYASLSQARVLNQAPEGVREAAEALADYVETQLTAGEHAMTYATLPSYYDLFWPTLKAVRGLGGSGRTDEINRAVIEHEAYREEQETLLHGDGPRTEIEYRLGWARTYLKGMGLLENPARAIWSATEVGRGRS
jgi:hypothetical protein